LVGRNGRWNSVETRSFQTPVGADAKEARTQEANGIEICGAGQGRKSLAGADEAAENFRALAAASRGQQ